MTAKLVRWSGKLLSRLKKLFGMKPQEGPDPRPKEYFDQFHHRTRTQEPDCYVYGTIHVLVFFGIPFFRYTCVGLENVPESGPVILAPNHFSFADHFLLAVFLRRIVQFMAKSQMFKPPWEKIYTHGGTFPVRRRLKDEETFITAKTILEKEKGTVAMYCEGGRSRTGKISKEAKPGIGRLTLESGVAVVPVAIHGSNKLRKWWDPRLPPITVVFGLPTYYGFIENPSREQQQFVADAILHEIRELHENLERPAGWLREWVANGVDMVFEKACAKLENS